MMLPTRPALMLIACCVSLLACSSPPQPTAAATEVKPVASGDGSAIVTGRASTGAIITMQPVDGAEAPAPDGPVIMDQYSKQFVPSLLFARVGQVVEFRNSEDVDHNVLVVRTPTGTTVMNESGSQGQVFRRTFDEGTYEVTCDVHPGMRGTIIATRAPFASGTDAAGNFSFYDVPPGQYAVTFNVNGKETTKQIEVSAPKTEVTAS